MLMIMDWALLILPFKQMQAKNTVKAGLVQKIAEVSPSERQLKAKARQIEMIGVNSPRTNSRRAIFLVFPTTPTFLYWTTGISIIN